MAAAANRGFVVVPSGGDRARQGGSGRVARLSSPYPSPRLSHNPHVFSPSEMRITLLLSSPYPCLPRARATAKNSKMASRGELPQRSASSSSSTHRRRASVRCSALICGGGRQPTCSSPSAEEGSQQRGALGSGEDGRGIVQFPGAAAEDLRL